MVYPGSSIIRQWVTFANAGDRPLTIVEPGFLSETHPAGRPRGTRFPLDDRRREPARLVDAEDRKTQLPPKPRTFDSYEPFPRRAPRFPATGSTPRSLLNGKQVWPANGWQYVANATVTVPVDFSVDVAAGDKLAFLVNMNGNIGLDTTAFDPTIKYDDGEKHVGLEGVQRQAGPERLALSVHRGRQVRRSGLLSRAQTMAEGEGQRHGHAVCRRGRSASRREPGCRAGLDRAQGGPRASHGGGLQHGQSAGSGGGYGFRMGIGDLRPLVCPAGQRHARRRGHRLGLFRPLGLVVPSDMPTARSRSN